MSYSIGIKKQSKNSNKEQFFDAITNRRSLFNHIEVKDMTSWIVLIYAIIVAAGGVMGYLKANSLASLIAGGVAGLLLAGSSFAMMRDAYQAGWWIALVVTILLLARFGMAALKEFKMMPGGLVIIMSLIVLAVLLTHRGS
ncbi:MAG: TMEM14 family protein [Acidobacteria bacterium]|nr:TMEM14 family protein [Acidobacteriota bacterium]